jgi:hypothetical protein
MASRRTVGPTLAASLRERTYSSAAYVKNGHFGAGTHGMVVYRRHYGAAPREVRT